MGIVYAAELRPSKIELMAAWLPKQAWFDGGEPERLGSFRFDDPAGEVGIETHIVGAGGRVYQVPLTYRGAPLEGAEDFLIGTLEHSVLGSRWVYDATADPVYTAELASALLAGKPQVEEVREVDGQLETLPHTALIFSTGTSDAGLPELRFGVPATADGTTRINAETVQLAVLRVLELAGAGEDASGVASMTATWAGQELPVLVATAARA